MPSQPLSRRAFLAVGGGAAAPRRVRRVVGRRTRPRRPSAGADGAKGLSAFRMEIEPYVSDEPQRLRVHPREQQRRRTSPVGPPRSWIAPPGWLVRDRDARDAAHGGAPRGPRRLRRRARRSRMPATGGAPSTIEGHGGRRARVPGQCEPGYSDGRRDRSGRREPTVARPAGHRPAVHPHRRRERSRAVRVPRSRRSTRSSGRASRSSRCSRRRLAAQSRYCGPVLDQLIGLAPDYGDRDRADPRRDLQGPHEQQPRDRHRDVARHQRRAVDLRDGRHRQGRPAASAARSPPTRSAP